MYTAHTAIIYVNHYCSLQTEMYSLDTIIYVHIAQCAASCIGVLSRFSLSVQLMHRQQFSMFTTFSQQKCYLCYGANDFLCVWLASKCNQHIPWTIMPCIPAITVAKGWEESGPWSSPHCGQAGCNIIVWVRLTSSCSSGLLQQQVYCKFSLYA